MLNKTTMTAAMLAGMLGLTGAALAQPGPGGWHHEHHDGLLEGVTLTDAQKSQIQAMRKADWQSNKALMQQMRAVRQQIDSALLASGTVTEANLAPLVQQKESIMQQLDAKHMSEQIAVRNMLTSAQIAQAASTHSQMAALHAQEQALHQQTAPAAQSE